MTKSERDWLNLYSHNLGLKLDSSWAIVFNPTPIHFLMDIDVQSPFSRVFLVHSSVDSWVLSTSFDLEATGLLSWVLQQAHWLVSIYFQVTTACTQKW